MQPELRRGANRRKFFALKAKTIDRDAHSIMFDLVSVTRAACAYLKPRENEGNFCMREHPS
jgi:hypothetical protein